MINAIQTSLTGLQTAQNRATEASVNIVQKTAKASQQFQDGMPSRYVTDTYQKSQTGQAAQNQPPNNYKPTSAATKNSPASLPQDDDVVNDMVTLKIATQAYKANATVMRTLDETLGEFIESFGNDIKA